MINMRPEKMRSQVSDGPDGLTITIPTKKNIFMLIFLAAWLVAWAVGEVTVPTIFLFGKTPPSVRLFSAVWLAAWTIAGMFAIYVWLWNITGRELIRIASKGIIIKRAVFGYGIERQYDMVYITNLRVSQEGVSSWNFSPSLRFWGLGGGLIAFDYGAKTYRFGVSIDEAEAGDIVEKILKRVNIPQK